MKNYWHIVALSTAMSLLTVFIHSLVVLLLFLAWLFYLYIFKRIRLAVLLLSLLAFFFLLFYLPNPENLSAKEPTSDESLEKPPGKIISPISETDKKIEFIFRTEPYSEKVIVVYFKNEEPIPRTATDQLKYGAMCRIIGQAMIPPGARNPHQFDYQRYLLQKEISQQIILASLDDLSCENSSYMHYLYQLRSHLLELAGEKLQSETVAWLNALVLGDDSYIDPKIKAIFQRWSLSHILAISGLHVGIIVGLIYFLLIQTGITTKEKAQWIMIYFLPVYALLAGGEPSVWRSSLMVIFVIVLHKANLKYSYTDVISLLFIVLILLNKYIIFHIGFQLSFSVTFGLIISSRWLASSPSRLAQLLQISFVSQMAILPLQVHYFSIFQPLSILLNVIVVPYFSIFVIPFMFLLLLCIKLPAFIIVFFEKVFLQIHHFFIFLLEKLDFHLDYPFIIGKFPIYFSLIYYVIFMMLMIALENRRLKLAFRNAVLLIIYLVFLTMRPYFSPLGLVTMLDIGQGDAFVVELPYRKGVFLIDAGAALAFPDFESTDKQYEQIIKPFLYSKGINKLDAVFISHEHADHYGSLPFIMRDMVVDEIVISEKYVLDPRLEHEWLDRGVLITRAHFDEILNRKGQEFRVVSPEVDMDDANANSLVLYTVFGGHAWLFMGDASKETEMKVMQNYGKLPVDVLKVGHHGSNTSTDERFLEYIAPRYALIPVGVNNIYGHPTSAVIDALTEQGIEIYRTDEAGAVEFYFEGDKGVFQRFIEK